MRGGEKMADGKASVHSLATEVRHVAAYLERVNFAAYASLLEHPWRLMWLNGLAGVFRGIGIGIGFTVIAGFIILMLQQLEILNVPIIGKYIAELVKIVQAQLHVHSY
jgi:hypothetical protein